MSDQKGVSPNLFNLIIGEVRGITLHRDSSYQYWIDFFYEY